MGARITCAQFREASGFISRSLDKGMERGGSLPSAQSQCGLLNRFSFLHTLIEVRWSHRGPPSVSYLHDRLSHTNSTQENTDASEITTTAPLMGLNLNCGLMFLMIKPFSNPAWGLLGPPWQGSALSPGIFLNNGPLGGSQWGEGSS